MMDYSKDHFPSAKLVTAYGSASAPMSYGSTSNQMFVFIRIKYE